MLTGRGSKQLRRGEVAVVVGRHIRVVMCLPPISSDKDREVLGGYSGVLTSFNVLLFCIYSPSIRSSARPSVLPSGCYALRV